MSIVTRRAFTTLPKNSPRLVLGYDVDLSGIGDELEYRLDLPTNLKKCTVDLHIAATEGLSIASKPEAEATRDGGRERLHRARAARSTPAKTQTTPESWSR